MPDAAVMLHDAAISSLDSSWVVEVIRGALLAHGRGELIGPPRLSAALGEDERDPPDSDPAAVTLFCSVGLAGTEAALAAAAIERLS